MAQPGYPKQSKPKMNRSKKRKILEAEGRMQQGQTGSVGEPIDVSGDTESEDYETFVNKKKGGGMLKKKKKGYAMGGAMKKKVLLKVVWLKKATLWAAK